MSGRVYHSLLGGLFTLSVGVRHLGEQGMDWAAGGWLLISAVSLVLAFLYWRSSPRPR